MTLNLIVENDKNELSVHSFDSNIIRIGRAHDNDFVLDERNISRHHLQMEVVDGRIVVEDMRSYNGTFINNREITRKVEIFVGDVISMGDYHLYLEKDDSVSTSSAREKIGPRVAEKDLILSKNGSIGGRVYPVDGAETVIGSHAGADIYIFGPDIPEVHSKIIYDGRVNLLVKGDSNRTLPLVVNGMTLESVDIRNGDEIRVGDYLFEYIEKGTEYDPEPFLVAAEDERRRKLLEDINKKKILSFHECEDDFEKTEVTLVRPDSRRKMLIPLLVGAAVVVAALVAVFFLLGCSNTDYSMKKGSHYNFLIDDCSGGENVGKCV